jgi:hypothetical protein
MRYTASVARVVAFYRFRPLIIRFFNQLVFKVFEFDWIRSL